MSRPIWNNPLLTWRDGPHTGSPTLFRLAWDATRFTLHSPPLSYQLPVGCQPAGEPWAWTSFAGDTYVYVPIVRGVDWVMSGTPDGEELLPYGSGLQEYWHVIPALVVLEMEDWSEPVEIIDIWPEHPRIGENYCDAIGIGTLREGTFAGGGLRHHGVNGWANIEWAGGGALVEILRVGPWVIPRIEASNQLIALNLDTRQYVRQRGWDGLLPRLAEVPGDYDPREPWPGGLTFTHEYYVRRTYEVLGPLADGSIALYRESHTHMQRIVSAIDDELTPPHTVTHGGGIEDPNHGQTASTRDTIYRTWACATSGAGRAAWADPPDRRDWNNNYQWVGPSSGDLRCGNVPGGPWVTTYYRGIEMGMRVVHLQPGRNEDGTPIFQAALQADLDHVLGTPALAGTPISEVEGRWEEWRLPTIAEPEAVITTIRELPDVDAYEGATLTNGRSHEMLSGGLNTADLDLQPIATHPGFWAIGNTEMPELWDENGRVELESSIDYSLSSGTGVILHKFTEDRTTDPVTGEVSWGWWADSMDQNNCPGPGGPYLYSGDPGGPAALPDHIRYHLTRLWITPYGKQQLYRPTRAHSANYVSDGDLMIWLPRAQADKITSATTLDEFSRQARIVAYRRDGEDWIEDWELATLDVVSPVLHPLSGSAEPESGGCVSNGILTRGYLYLVLRDGAGQSLLQIAASTGEVASKRPLSAPLSARADIYRDNLVAVNRRLVGLGATTFEVIAVGT